MINWVVGIDPGASGSIVAVGDGGRFWRIATLDEDVHHVVDSVNAFMHAASALDYNICKVVIESVHAMPKQGVTSMFNFGVSVGRCQVFAEMLGGNGLNGTKIFVVTPQKWRKALGLPMGKQTRTQRKNDSKELAKKLFPEVKITHRNADAFLIAEYGRREFLKSGD